MQNSSNTYTSRNIDKHIITVNKEQLNRLISCSQKAKDNNTKLNLSYLIYNTKFVSVNSDTLKVQTNGYSERRKPPTTLKDCRNP